MALDGFGQLGFGGWGTEALPEPPPEGGGVHSWLFRVSCLMWREGHNAAEIAAYLKKHSPRFEAREVNDAIRNAAKEVGVEPGDPGCVKGFGGHQGTRARKMPTAALDEELLGVVVRNDPQAFYRLSGGSPNDPTRFTCAQLIDLFPGDPLICMASAEGPGTARTARRGEWRGQEQLHSLVVPNPMTKQSGLNQSGKWTARCLDNTGPRRYLVVESDYQKREPGALHVQARRDPSPCGVFQAAGPRLFLGQREPPLLVPGLAK